MKPDGFLNFGGKPVPFGMWVQACEEDDAESDDELERPSVFQLAQEAQLALQKKRESVFHQELRYRNAALAAQLGRRALGEQLLRMELAREYLKKAEEEVVMQMKKVEVLDFLKDGAAKELEHAKWELAQMK